MAPPHKIDSYLQTKDVRKIKNKVAIPAFLERKKIEEKLSASLKEKEFLIKEIHHRVKNNLQIISSLLNLQADSISDAATKEKYTESIGRIKSMAIIHELLYQSKNLSNIRIKDYLEELVSYISSTYNLGKEIKVNLLVAVKHKFIDLDKAIPCGIIINELLSNAFKYAFVNTNREGKINILFEENNQHYKLTVFDNGIGLPESVNVKTSDTLGLQLINSLVEQLDGELAINVDKGTSFVISFS
jgi:two-component sensor histidine kinase